MDLIRHDKFMSWGAVGCMVVAVCFLNACKQPSDSDLTDVTGGSQTTSTATVTTTTVPTPVVVNGPLGNSALAFTPQSYAFGTLVQNSGSATKSFTVINISDYTLMLGAMSSSDANFAITANNCTNGLFMLTNSICTFTVQFAPAVNGNLSASIVIPYGVAPSGNSFTSALSVTGAGTSLAAFAGLDHIDNQTPTSMQLHWTDVAGAATYQVYTVDSGSPVLAASVISANLVAGIGCGVGSPAGAGQCSYTVTGLLPATFHSYRVLASDFLGVRLSNTHDVTSETTSDFLDILGAASAAAGACTSFTVALTQADHATAENVSSDTPIAVTGLGSGAIYSDNTCGTPISGPVVIASTASSKTFYFKDNVAESLTIAGTRSANSSATKAFTVNPSSVIAAIAYVSIPSAYAASSSASMTITAALKDSLGNIITTDNATTVTLSLASGTSALGGILMQTVSHGVATFSGITYMKVETITIKATENTSSHNVTSGSISVNPGVAASVAWGTAPIATYTASSTTPMTTFTAALKDAFGNVVTSDNSSTITLSLASGSGTLSGTLTKTVSSGVATFDNVTATKAESITITATKTGSGFSVNSSNVTVSPAGFSLSQSLVSSAASVNSGASITVTLTTKDDFGNGNPSGITSPGFTSSAVGGTGSFGSVTNAGAGVYTASFTGIIVGSVTLGATINGGTVTSAPSPATVAVNPGSAIATVAYGVAPSTYTASGTTPMTAFTAKILDSNGNVITTNSTATITLSLASGSSSLSGTLTQTVSQGVATFNDITYTKAEAITIKATENASGSHLNVTSGFVTVNPSPVIASVAFVAAPPATYTASNTTPMTAFTAAIKDSFGNIITTNSTSQLHLGLSSGSGSLSATVYVSVSNGIATFSDVTYTKPETIRLAVDLGSFSVTSSDITVTAHLAFTTQPSSSGNTDTALPQQPVVAVQDGAGATASGATNAITLTAYSDSACTVQVTGGITATTNPVSAISGVSAFGGVKILKTNVIRIGAGATGITSACSSAVAIAAGAVNLAQSSVTWFPASLIANNTSTSAITVTLKDANGNGIAGKTVTATSDRGADTISGSGTSTNSSGVVNLTAKSSSTGSSNITVVGNGTAMNPTVKVLFLSATPLTDYQSRLFNAIGPGDNSSSVKSVWKDLARVATTYDGSLTNFLFDSTSGWSGTPPKTYSDEVLADNPVGYWRLGESSGTTANDISGNAINGTYTNVTLAQAGALAGDSDTAVSFNGTSSIVDLGHGAALKGVFDSGKKWTVSMWFKTAHLNGNGPWLLSKDFTSHTSPYYQFNIRQGADGSVGAAIWRGDTYTGQNVGVSSPAIPTGVWTYLAVTVDITNLSAVTIALYINGGTPLTSTADLPGGIYTNFDSPVTLGANKNLTPGSYNFDGLIDDVAVFPSALSAARILAHYNAGVHPDAPLVFNGSTSNSYVDFGTGVNNNTNFSFETWIKPANTSATGKVILSNGTTVNPGTSSQTDTGLTLRQSKVYPGKLELLLGETGDASYSQEVLSDSPVGYWRLGETSGATAADSSGNGHDGTYTNIMLGGAGALLGDSDTSAQFNGSTSFAEALGLTLGDQYTMELWFKTSLDSSDPQYLMFRGSSGCENFGFYQRHMIVYDGGGYPSGSTTLSASTWYHAVMVRNGTHVRIYLNGSDEIGDYDFGAGSYNSSRIGIGKRCGDGAWPFQGLIDEVAIYNTALSPARILTHYNSGIRNKTCTSKSTFANNVWRFISGVFDSTGPTLKLFVDGTQECSITNAGAAFTGSANPLRAGRDNSNGTTNSWAGQVADLRTYGAALTAANVRDNWGATVARFGAFDPRTISGLKFWLTADAIVGHNDGDAVALWSDSSGNGNDATQATVANQPVYKAGILNGKPVVRFGSLGQTNALNTPSITMADRTVFVVVTQIGAPVGIYGYHTLVIQGSAPYFQLYATSNVYFYDGVVRDTGAAFSGTKLISEVTGGTGSMIFVNSASVLTSGIPSSSITATFMVGGYPSNGASGTLNGDIAEVLIYNTALSDADRKRIEAYLNAKYGLY